MKAAFRRFIARLLERQARRLIERRRLKVVAVAGSVGKTSTRLAIATVLSSKYRLPQTTRPGYNSEIGLPLSVFDLPVPGSLFNPFAWIHCLIRTEQTIRGAYPYEVLVLELGTDHPGEIARYVRYLKPDIGVITAITPEHMANFPGGLDQVADEELTLVSASKQVIVNYDDTPEKYRAKYIEPHPGRVYFGSNPASGYGFKLKSTDPVNGTSGDITLDGQTVIENVRLHVYGAHSAKAAAAAYAAGHLLGLSAEQLQDGLGRIRPVAGRMNTLPGVNGSVVVDDTYNSSPEAVVAGLKALADAPVAGRRITVMGSMNELGEASPRYHAEAGAAASGVDLLITIGQLANDHLGPAALKAGLKPERYFAATSPYAAGEYLKPLLQPGDVVLAKGSQNGVFAEEAVKAILADPADAAKLVRQSPDWLRAKAKQFPNSESKV